MKNEMLIMTTRVVIDVVVDDDDDDDDDEDDDDDDDYEGEGGISMKGNLSADHHHDKNAVTMMKW